MSPRPRPVPGMRGGVWKRTGHRPPPRIISFTAVNPPGPTVTADLGYGPPEDSASGGWGFVSRPRRKGFTEWNGQDPYVLTVPIVFDQFGSGASVEAQIETLRRIMRVPVGPRREPAVVRIQSPAIPPPLLGLNWVIQDMAPDLDKTVRRDDGARTRAPFTVTLLEYVAVDLIVAVRPTPAKAAQDRAPATPAKPRTGTAGTARTYTVKKGDTLWEIAARHLGDGRRWRQIADLNGVRDPRKLRIGTVLRLP